MVSLDQQLVLQYEHSRPGLQLVGVDDVAIPFSWVRVDVLAQERKSFPLLEEFVLRAIDAGLFSEKDIGLLLGLDAELVAATVVDLMHKDFVVRKLAKDDSWQVALSPIGKSAALELASVTPVVASLEYGFDRLQWCVTAFKRNDLISHSDAKSLGFRILPGRPSEVSDSDFTPQNLNRMIAEDEDTDSQVEVLAVQKINPRARLFLPAKLLIFTDPKGSEAQLGVAIDGEQSREHELEIAQLGGADALGITVAPPADPPLSELTDEARSVRVSADEVREIRTGKGGLADDSLRALTAEPGRPADDELDKIKIRAVSVHEHRDLLQCALTTATRRLLIVAPWVKRAVVDADFIGHLETRLRTGVQVTVAHGYGIDDRGSDESALRQLANLQNRFSERFDLVRLENSHAKILIWDDNWINTSFNWMSFKGDPSRTYRAEEGTLIKIPKDVDSAYTRYRALIERERRT